MGRQLNKWFNEDEFACCRGTDYEVPAPYIDEKLLEVLTAVREFFGAPFVLPIHIEHKSTIKLSEVRNIPITYIQVMGRLQIYR